MSTSPQARYSVDALNHRHGLDSVTYGSRPHADSECVKNHMPFRYRRSLSVIRRVSTDHDQRGCLSTHVGLIT
jgi:hypothetical protein